jgi:hypothetical protein
MTDQLKEIAQRAVDKVQSDGIASKGILDTVGLCSIITRACEEARKTGVADTLKACEGQVQQLRQQVENCTEIHRHAETIELLREQLNKEKQAAITIAVTCATMGCKGDDGGIVSAVKEMAFKLRQAELQQLRQQIREACRLMQLGNNQAARNLLEAMK